MSSSSPSGYGSDSSAKIKEGELYDFMYKRDAEPVTLAGSASFVTKFYPKTSLRDGKVIAAYVLCAFEPLNVPAPPNEQAKWKSAIASAEAWQRKAQAELATAATRDPLIGELVENAKRSHETWQTAAFRAEADAILRPIEGPGVVASAAQCANVKQQWQATLPKLAVTSATTSLDATLNAVIAKPAGALFVLAIEKCMSGSARSQLAALGAARARGPRSSFLQGLAFLDRRRFAEPSLSIEGMQYTSTPKQGRAVNPHPEGLTMGRVAKMEPLPERVRMQFHDATGSEKVCRGYKNTGEWQVEKRASGNRIVPVKMCSKWVPQAYRRPVAPVEMLGWFSGDIKPNEFAFIVSGVLLQHGTEPTQLTHLLGARL